MSNELLTENQIKEIRHAISIKVTAAYEEKKLSFIKNTTPNNYSTLADEINKANGIDIKSKTGNHSSIKNEWLSGFFTKEKLSFEIEKLNLVSKYLGYSSWDDYCVNIDPKVLLFRGEFSVYWKGTLLEGADVPVINDYDLIIGRERCIFKPKDGKQATFESEAPEYKFGNLYINLKDKSDRENVNIVISIGNTDVVKLEYISALYLAVDSDLTPCSGPLLLVRKTVKDIDKDLIEEYYNRFATKTLIKAYKANRIKKMRDQLRKQYNERQRLKGLFGYWFVITKNKNGGYEQAKMSILSKNDLYFESIKNVYTEGYVRLKSGEFVILTLEHEERSATVIGETGYHDKLGLVNEIRAVFVSTGNYAATSGFLLLIRAKNDTGFIDKKEDFDKIEPYDFEDLEVIRKLGVSEEAITKLKDCQNSWV